MQKNLPIAAQLAHPDAWFYHARHQPLGNTVVGFFQGDHTQPFSFPLADFLAAARDEGIIDEYREDLSSVWLDDSADGSTVPTLEWLAQFLADGDKFLQTVLATCAKDQIDRRISTARATLARMVNRKGMTYDDLAEYYEAVEALRDLLELFETHPKIQAA